jgi:nitroreductase
MSESWSKTALCFALVPAAAVVGYVAARRQARPALDPEDAERFVQQRKSVFPKEYDPVRRVPREIVEKMLYNANFAPSHGKTWPWRFVVFSGDALEALGKFEAELYRSKTPAHKFMQEKHDKILKNKRLASFVIAICMKRQDTEKIPEVEEIEAVACAVQNMHIIACAYGVGAYWSSGAQVYSEEMKTYLGLQGKDKVLGMFYVGYPKNPAPRENRDDVATDKVQWRT